MVPNENRNSGPWDSESGVLSFTPRDRPDAGSLAQQTYPSKQQKKFSFPHLANIPLQTAKEVQFPTTGKYAPPNSKINFSFPRRESNPGRLGENQESSPLDHVGRRRQGRPAPLLPPGGCGRCGAGGADGAGGAGAVPLGSHRLRGDKARGHVVRRRSPAQPEPGHPHPHRHPQRRRAAPRRLLHHPRRDALLHHAGRHPDHLRPQVPAGPSQLAHGPDPALSPPQYSRRHQPRRGRRGAQSGHQQPEPPGGEAIHGGRRSVRDGYLSRNHGEAATPQTCAPLIRLSRIRPGEAEVAAVPTSVPLLSHLPPFLGECSSVFSPFVGD